MRNTLILTLLMACNTGLLAQDSTKLNLQECIELALQRNNGLQQFGIQQSIQDNILEQSHWNRAPVINGSANHNYNVGRSIDPFTNAFSTQTFQSNSFSLSAGLLLYNGGRINQTIRSNRLGLEAMDYGRKAMENDIALAVASTYLLILQSQAQLDQAIAQQELSKNQLDQAVMRVKAGQDNKASELALRAQLASDGTAIVRAQNQIELAYVQLAELLQLPAGEKIAVETPTIQPADNAYLNLEQLMDQAIQFYPDLMEARLLEQKAEEDRRIARSSMFPSLSAYGNLGTVYSESGVEYNTQTVLMPIGYVASTQEEVLSLVPVSTIREKSFNDQIRDNFGQSFGLSLSVPILNNQRNRTNLDNARLNLELAGLQSEARYNALRNELTQAISNQQAALATYLAAIASEEAQRLNYRFLDERYRAGIVTETELLQAKNNWMQAERSLTNATYELVFRNMIIAFYQGKPIQL